MNLVICNCIFAIVNTIAFTQAVFYQKDSPWFFALMLFNYVIYYAVQKGSIDANRNS